MYVMPRLCSPRYSNTYTVASPNLWSYLKEDWKGGCPIRLSFGPPGLFWGEKEYISPDKGHIVQAFGIFPSGMSRRLTRASTELSSLDIPFASIGGEEDWIVGTRSGTFHYFEDSDIEDIGPLNLVTRLVLFSP
jgi:hypothetical protein